MCKNKLEDIRLRYFEGYRGCDEGRVIADVRLLLGMLEDDCDTIPADVDAEDYWRDKEASIRSSLSHIEIDEKESATYWTDRRKQQKLLEVGRWVLLSMKEGGRSPFYMSYPLSTSLIRDSLAGLPFFENMHPEARYRLLGSFVGDTWNVPKYLELIKELEEALDAEGRMFTAGY